MDGIQPGDDNEWAPLGLDQLIELEAPPASRRRSRLRLWVTLGAVAGLVAAAVALISTEPDRDPDKALASAQALVEEATSFRFAVSLDADGFDVDGYREAVEASSTPEEAEEELGEIGDGDLSAQAEGEFASPDWHSAGSSQFGDDSWHSEAILADEVLYSRFGSDADELAESSYWADDDYAEDRADRKEVLENLADARAELPFSVDDFPEVAAQIDTFFAAELYLTGFGDQLGNDLERDPRGYLDAVAGLADPSVASTDGDLLTLHVRMRPSADVAAVFDDELPPADIELDLDGDDQPVALRMVVASAGVELRIEVAFSDWGADIQIDPPSDDELEDLEYEFDEVGEAIEEDDASNGDQDFEEVGEAIEGSADDGNTGSRRSAVTGDELRQLPIPQQVSLVRPAQLGDGLTLAEVAVDHTGECTTVTIWYEGNSGYLVVWLSPKPCVQDSPADAVMGETAVRVDTDDPARRDAAIESLEPVTVDQLATELDAAR